MVAVVLVVLGLACCALSFLLAFTLYGVVAAIAGAGCAGTGMLLLLVRYGPGRGTVR